jgi:diacylglycerol kinase (ATP)
MPRLLERAGDAVERVRGRAREARLEPMPRRPPGLIRSFNYAIEGIVHVLRAQRNMRLHFLAGAIVIIAAAALDVDRFELIGLLISISFVLVAEMVNSAVEAAIDIATSSFDPLAKLAKDIAAGAVLIASINAVAVGYLVFSSEIGSKTSDLLSRLREAPATLTIAVFVLVVLIVIATKALTGRGTPLRGGLPSGHAALAFAAWMSVTQLLGQHEHRFLVSSIMFGVALLVGHTRIESGVHSTLEVVYGALIGALIPLVIFQLFF